jgi:hypothetical protein
MRDFRAAVFLILCVISSNVRAADDPLPSWNDGPAKTAILQFVQATTDQSNAKFVAPEERVAAFDQDGTLWVEHPLYTQVVYCLERVPAVVAKKPEFKNIEPFKTVLSGNREAMARLTLRDLDKILAATLTGITVDKFQAEAKKWLATARDPRWQRPYTELVYQPDDFLRRDTVYLLGIKAHEILPAPRGDVSFIPIGGSSFSTSIIGAGPSSASTRRAGRS